MGWKVWDGEGIGGVLRGERWGGVVRWGGEEW